MILMSSRSIATIVTVSDSRWKTVCKRGKDQKEVISILHRLYVQSSSLNSFFFATIRISVHLALPYNGAQRLTFELLDWSETEMIYKSQ